MSLFDKGDDVFKGAIHGAVFALTALMTAYNVIAYRRRPTPRLAMNALLYGTIAAVEVGQVVTHVKGEY